MPFWRSAQVKRQARPSESFRKRHTTFQILFFIYPRTEMRATLRPLRPVKRIIDAKHVELLSQQLFAEV
jgi:hypothetical protein